MGTTLLVVTNFSQQKPNRLVVGFLLITILFTYVENKKVIN